jgi:UDP-glucose:glycoprotein glucosyltransferase
VYDGQVTPDQVTNISTYFYDLPTTDSRRNRYIHLPTVGIFNLPDLFSRTSFHVSATSFLYPRKQTRNILVHSRLHSLTAKSETIPLNLFSLFVVADFNSAPGLSLLKEALESMVCTFAALSQSVCMVYISCN